MRAGRQSAVPVDEATVQILRRDLANQLARVIREAGFTQIAAAEHLQIPQPTVSNIVNGRVDKLSIELLLRIAVRAELPLRLETGRIAEDAGVYRLPLPSREPTGTQSPLAAAASARARRADRSMNPTERLEAFLEHNQLVAALEPAGLRR